MKNLNQDYLNSSAESPSTCHRFQILEQFEVFRIGCSTGSTLNYNMQRLLLSLLLCSVSVACSLNTDRFLTGLNGYPSRQQAGSQPCCVPTLIMSHIKISPNGKILV